MSRFTYYCASFWHRYNEPQSVAVVLQSPTWGVGSKAPEVLTKAIESAMDDERQYCAEEWNNEEPDICWSGVHPAAPKSLFTPAELREHRKALQSGEVIWLSR